MSRFGLDPLDVAFYDTVHEYIEPKTGQKGVEPLARRLSMNPGTLQNKANPNAEGHQINVHEARAVMLAADDYRVLEQLAADCHHATYPLVPMDSTPNAELLQAVLAVSKECGEVSTVIGQALNDGRISAAEFVQADGEINDALRALVELRERLKASVVDPEHLPVTMRAVS